MGEAALLCLQNACVICLHNSPEWNVMKYTESNRYVFQN